MTVNEIVEFITDRPGYLKEGAKRLANKVLKGKASIEDCKEALLIARLNNGTMTEVLEGQYVDTLPQPNLKLKSRWQGANGKWLESYKSDDTTEDKLSKEDIESSIKNVLKDIKPLKLESIEVPASKKSMLVWTADKHIGADTTGSQHDIPYNERVFIDRMHQLATNIHIKSYEVGKFDTLVIADLGDATDGQDGYTASRTHSLPQNMTNKEVFETYFKVHTAFIDYVVQYELADNYEFWFNTCSNHGGSYEYACARAFQIYIETKYPQVKVLSFDKFIGHTKFKDVTYILTHGKDDKNRKFGLPLYPDPKTEVFIDNYLKMNKLSFDKNIRLIKGDLHQSCSAPCKNINKYRNVASMFGSSGWVMDNYGYTPAGTDYEILDEATGEILEGTFWYN